MSTPIINAINNVNDSSIATLFETVANNSVARDNLSQSDRNVDAVGNSDIAAAAIGVNGDAARLCTVRREGNAPSNYPELSDVASDSSLMQGISSRPASANIMARSGPMMDSVTASTTAMDAVSASATAMDAVSASQTARDAVNASGVGYDAIASDSMAIGKFVAGNAGLTPGDYANIDAVASSQTAMDAVSASATAMDAVSASATARDAVNASDLAYDAIASDAMAIGKYAAGIAGLTPTNYANIDAVASDADAMDAVSASQTVRDLIGTSGVGYDAIASDAMAIGKYAAGIAGLTPTNYADIDAVASDADAMDAVSASATAMDVVSDSNTARDSIAGTSTAVSTLNGQATGQGVGQLVGDGGPNSGASPVYGRSRGVYIDKLVHDPTSYNRGSSTIWVDCGDEVKQYNSGGGKLVANVEEIAFHVYHKHQYSNTGIESVVSYEW